MRTKIIFITCFAVLTGAIPLFALAAIAPAAATPAASTPFYYGVWLPYWSAQDGAADVSIHLASLYEVSPFSYEIGPSGALVDDLNIGNGSWNTWFGAVRELGVKIIPTIAWFDGQGIQSLLSNTTKRRAEETRIARLVESKNFSGIDIDFESMLGETQPYYSLFIEGLAERLHPEGKLLTCTVEARTPPAELYQTIPSDIVYAEDYSVLNKYCDEVRIMAYDEDTIDLTLDAEKGNGSLYAPVTDPDWVKSVLALALQQINPKKVVLGIPTYGYEYEVSWENGETIYQRVRAFDYMDAMDRAESMGLVPTRDSGDELSFTYASSTYIQEPPILVTTVLSAIEPPVLTNPVPNATTTFFVTFPDAQSVEDEITLAKSMGIRGAMLFKADGDLDPAIWGELK